jgi:preprotein translocase subunit YajC
MGFLLILIIGFILMWLLIIVPQRRRQAAHQQMVANLEPGDEIITSGGLYGTVRTVGDEELGVEVAPGVDVRIAKRAVATILPPEEEEEEEVEQEEAVLEADTEPADQERS